MISLFFSVSMVVEAQCDDALTAIVNRQIPAAVVSRSHGKELTHTLPLNDIDKFSGMQLWSLCYIMLWERIHPEVNKSHIHFFVMDFGNTFLITNTMPPFKN